MPRDYEIKTRFTAVDKVSQKINRIQSKLLRFTARASMALRKLDRITMKLTKGLGGILKRGALIAAGAATGLYLAINRTTASMDELAKKTRAMNFPIEEFQEWRFAAEQSGVASEVFDKSLQKFTKTVGELKGGYGALYTALRKTDRGLLKQLQGTEDVDKAFELYLQAIEKAPNAMDKAALATAAFGRSGADMINLANAGADEIARLRAEMRENGVVTERQAAIAEKYNDTMNRVGLTVKSFFVEALEPLLPMLTDAAESMRAWMVANRGMINTKVKEYIKKIPHYIEQIVKWAPKVLEYVKIFAEIVVGIKLARAALWLFNKAALASATSMGKVGTASATAMGQAQTSTAAATRGVGAFGKAMGALGAFVVGWEIGTILHDKLVEPFMAARHEMELLKNDIDDTSKRDLSRRGEAQIQKDIQKVDTYQKQYKDDWLTYLFTNKLDRAKEIERMDKERSRLQSALPAAHQRANIAKYGDRSPGVSDASTSDFGVSTEYSSSESKETVEVVIKDETGRAKITKGKRRKGLKLVHTGAAQ